MKKLEEQLNQPHERLRLTGEEKRAMRLALQSHMLAHPLGGLKSPWYATFNLRLAVPVLSALVLCTGTAYAAQGTLPGDLLYPVKIHVTEPVEVALATTPAAKANVEAHLAARRVAEAQTLAARGELTASTTEELQDNFNAHAQVAVMLADQDETRATSTASTTSPTSAPIAGLRVTPNQELKETSDARAAKLRAVLDVQASILDSLKTQIGTQNSIQRDREKRTAPSSDTTSSVQATSSSAATVAPQTSTGTGEGSSGSGSHSGGVLPTIPALPSL